MTVSRRTRRKRHRKQLKKEQLTNRQKAMARLRSPWDVFKSIDTEGLVGTERFAGFV